jgi:hypothetical protein
MGCEEYGGESYIAESETDCKDDTDRFVYRHVVESNGFIACGHVIGYPSWMGNE